MDKIKVPNLSKADFIDLIRKEFTCDPARKFLYDLEYSNIKELKTLLEKMEETNEYLTKAVNWDFFYFFMTRMIESNNISTSKESLESYTNIMRTFAKENRIDTQKDNTDIAVECDKQIFGDLSAFSRGLSEKVTHIGCRLFKKFLTECIEVEEIKSDQDNTNT